MEFVELLEIVHDEPLFESGLLQAGRVNPAAIHRQLSRWKQSGKILQLRRGLYCLAPPYQKVRPHPFLIANRLVPHSYVSLHSALAYYGMIPEYVAVTTSVTTGRPASWETPLGVYQYRRIQVDYFEGITYREIGLQQKAFVATPEKALLDLIYLVAGSDAPEYLREMRLSGLDGLDWENLTGLAARYGKPKIGRAVRELRMLAGDEEELEDL